MNFILSTVILASIFKRLNGAVIVEHQSSPPPPIYAIPKTSFACPLDIPTGFFADPETNCQVFHYCQDDGRQDSYFCPNLTLFNQKILNCDWWYNVDCSSSVNFYQVNVELGIGKLRNDQYKSSNVEKVVQQSSFYPLNNYERSGKNLNSYKSINQIQSDPKIIASPSSSYHKIESISNSKDSYKTTNEKLTSTSSSDVIQVLNGRLYQNGDGDEYIYNDFNTDYSSYNDDDAADPEDQPYQPTSQSKSYNGNDDLVYQYTADIVNGYDPSTSDPEPDSYDSADPEDYPVYDDSADPEFTSI